MVAPTVKLKYLEKIFRSKVLALLLAKGKITPDHIHLLKSWKHSGFQVFCGPRILPRKIAAMENLARYIIRASFSQERLTYLPEPVVSLKVERVIDKILRHLGLWQNKQRPPPKPKTLEFQVFIKSRPAWSLFLQKPLLSPCLWPYFSP